MHEVLTHKFPFSEVRDKYTFNFQLSDAICVEDLRPFVTEPTEAPFGYQSLMERCWSRDHNERPEFSSILRELLMINSECLALKDPHSKFIVEEVFSTSFVNNSENKFHLIGMSESSMFAVMHKELREINIYVRFLI